MCGRSRIVPLIARSGIDSQVEDLKLANGMGISADYGYFEILTARRMTAKVSEAQSEGLKLFDH
jgi:hypothetical protein